MPLRVTDERDASVVMKKVRIFKISIEVWLCRRLQLTFFISEFLPSACSEL